MTSLSCLLPPPLSEDDFDALLADADHTRIRAHLEACPYCYERFEQYHTFPQRLKTLLGRGDCPLPDVLAEYQDGLLPEAQRAMVATHLTQCYRCTEELAAIAAFTLAMADEIQWAETLAVPPSAKGRIPTTNGSSTQPRIDFSALFRPLILLFPTLRPAVTGLKGGGADEAIQRLSASTDRLTVTLSTYPAADGNVRARAMVLAVEDADSDDDDAPFRWAGALWDMWRDRVPVASTLLDREAEGELSTLPPGDYTLHITAPFGERVVLAGIRIEGRGTAGAS